jgi:DNA-directed RNA polymerase specialized sigma24 family protein
VRGEVRAAPVKRMGMLGINGQRGGRRREVVQDALWSVVRRVEMSRGDSALGTWIYPIIANAACNKLRHRRRREVSWDQR